VLSSPLSTDRREGSLSPAMSGRAAPRYAPEDPTLPKPWRGLVDGSTAYLYYWNPETNVTQYERPLPPEDQLRPSPQLPQPVRRGISSAAVAAPDRRRRRSYSPDEADDRYAPRARTFHQVTLSLSVSLPQTFFAILVPSSKEICHSCGVKKKELEALNGVKDQI
jgi:hypothetical protein